MPEMYINTGKKILVLTKSRGYKKNQFKFASTA